MAEITMPRLSDTMEEGTIAQWLKKEGDKIARGDVLLEIETDKATMEQESYDEGILEKILVQNSQTVPIGTVIGIIGDGSGKTGGAGSATASAPTAAVATAPSQPAPVSVAATAAPVTNNGEGERVLASPMARRIAAEHGISLQNVTGSGPGGRIVTDDVLALAQSTSGAAPAVSAQAAPPPPAAAPAPVLAKPAPVPASVPVQAAPAAPASSGADYEDIELSRMGQTVARRMTESKQQVPHIYLTLEINMSEALKWRQTVNAAIERKGGSKASVNDIIIKAAAVALRKVPAINSGFVDNKIRMYKRVHIAFAVALPDGLLTPVVRDADQKSLSQIAQETRQMTEKARAGKLPPNDYQGGTFTISNLGMYGIESFQAVINQPQSAILAVGASKPTVVVKEGSRSEGSGQPEFEVIQAMKVTASFDHRSVNGAIGAQFLQALKNLMEDPMQLLV